jgi:hypothetical protein
MPLAATAGPRSRWMPLAVLALLAAAPRSALSGPAASPLQAATPAVPAIESPLEGQDAENFLSTAEVVAQAPISSGITHSQKLTLRDGARTAHAAWKTINEHVPGLQHMADGRSEFDFRDSWKHEVAAYELDKLLGAGLVPPTVERRINGRVGALQLWIEGAMTEVDRRRKKLEPPNRAIWNERRATERLLRELVYDTDRNSHNVLYDPTFRVWAIDFSRAFRILPQIQDPGRLDCFSRAVLARLRALDRQAAETHLGRWLDRIQIEGLMRRREQVLALADALIASRGEGATLLQ